ncbi:MAG: hypothetical protein AAF747_07200 [Planctomycetota bacterium]
MQRTTMTASVGACALLGCVLGLAGCQQNEGFGPRPVDDTERVVTSGVDIQDFDRVAIELSESLVNSGLLGRGGEPSIVLVSQFKNNTSRQIDRDRLMQSVRTVLTRSGRALAISEDPAAVAEADIRGFVGESSGPARPDYAIAVRIYEDRAQRGGTRQIAFFFQLTLSDLNRGLEVWQEEAQVVKQFASAAPLGL